jgi:hypothetical protein
MPLAETQILQGLIVSLKPDLALCRYVMQPKSLLLSLRMDRQSRDCDKASSCPVV